MRVFATLMASVLLAMATLPAAAQQIGTVAYAEPVLRGTPPGSGTRRLRTGTQIFADETIASSSEGRAQLMFLDQTTLSMGPNTTIVLDQFVFDPASGGGEMGLNLAEGTLRFIGGALSRDRPATITTPAATIGIRGSTAIVSHVSGDTVAVFVSGERMCISTAGGTSACTSRRGGVLNGAGYVGEVSPGFLNALITQVNNQPIGGASGAGGGGALGGGTGTGATFGNSGRGGGQSTSGAQFDTGLFGDELSLDQMMGGLLVEPDLNRPPPGGCVFRAATARVSCR